MNCKASHEPAFLRAFIALLLPEEIKEQLAAFQRELKQRLTASSFRWTPPAQVHLTLKFLGQIPRESLPSLKQALRQTAADVSPLPLSAANLGFFPDARKPRVCWVGIDGDLDGLRTMQERLDLLTETWAPREPRSFRPHLTLARVKPPYHAVARLVAEVPAPLTRRRLGHWEAQGMDLMQSELLSQGARHSSLAHVPFTASIRPGEA